MKKALLYFVMILCVLIGAEGLLYFIHNPEEQHFHWSKSTSYALVNWLIIVLSWYLPKIMGVKTPAIYWWPLMVAGVTRVALSKSDILTMAMAHGSRFYLAASCFSMALWIIETKLSGKKEPQVILKSVTITLFILFYGLL